MLRSTLQQVSNERHALNIWHRTGLETAPLTQCKNVRWKSLYTGGRFQSCSVSKLHPCTIYTHLQWNLQTTASTGLLAFVERLALLFILSLPKIIGVILMESARHSPNREELKICPCNINFDWTFRESLYPTLPGPGFLGHLHCNVTCCMVRESFLDDWDWGPNIVLRANLAMSDQNWHCSDIWPSKWNGHPMYVHWQDETTKRLS